MPAPPPVACLTATRPKAGHRPDENEDALAADPARLRFAAADGATEGWQSRSWARHLVRCFARRPPTPRDFRPWVAAARKVWAPPPPAAPAAWYAEAKRAEGAFATLLGLELRPTDGGGLAWKAVAVGDTCLLLVRGGRVEAAFPHAAAADFGSRPALLPSAPAADPPGPEWLAGHARPGDTFLLVTDAVAAFLLGLPGPDAWRPVLHAVDAGLATGDPAPLLEFLSRVQGVTNDDASALVVRVAPPEPPA